MPIESRLKKLEGRMLTRDDYRRQQEIAHILRILMRDPESQLAGRAYCEAEMEYGDHDPRTVALANRLRDANRKAWERHQQRIAHVQ
jgi:hypothetical protein